jgi:hypothetical protein
LSHPAIDRIISNKSHLRYLLEKAQPLLKKLSSPQWESNLRHKLEI